MASSLVPSYLFLSLLLFAPVSGLYIAAFNIQIFGQTKFSNVEVVNVLAQVSLAVAVSARAARHAAQHCCPW